MKKVIIGCVTYTTNEDGTITRTVDADKLEQFNLKIKQQIKEEL